MNMIPFDSDAARAAVAAATHAVAAECERLGITATPGQCESLATAVISHYQAFTAGMVYASGHDRPTTAPGQ